MIRGCRAAIRRSATAGPSGWRRPCSQLRSVCTLIPMALANLACVSPTNRRNAATSSPDSNSPRSNRRLRRAGIARANCSSLISGISAISPTHVCLVHPRFALRRKSSADTVDRVFLGLRPRHDDKAPTDQANRQKTIFHLGMPVVEHFQVGIRREEIPRFLERKPVFLLIAGVLGFIPRELHANSLPPPDTKSMTYTGHPRFCRVEGRQSVQRLAAQPRAAPPHATAFSGRLPPLVGCSG